MAEQYNFVARYSDLILHVRDEEVLVQLVNVRDCFEVTCLAAQVGARLLGLRVALSLLSARGCTRTHDAVVHVRLND